MKQAGATITRQKDRSHPVLLLLFTAISVVFRGWAAEPAPPADRHRIIPDVLVKLPHSTISARDFRRAIQDAATRNPAMFQLGESFLQHSIFIMEAVRLSLKAPTPEAIQARIQQRENEAGGPRSLKVRLADSGLTRADLRRMIREELLFEAITRLHHGMPLNAEIDRKKTLKTFNDLRREYAPVFHGMNLEQRAATVGGINFTADEIVDYILQWGREKTLSGILDMLVGQRLVLDEAKARGLDIDGLSARQILNSLFAPQLTKASLKKYMRGCRDKFTLVHAAHIFCAFDRKPGQAYHRQPGVDTQTLTDTRMRAEAIYEHLKQGEISFADAARKYSNCPTASQNGELGFLADAFSVKLGLPARAYALDMIRTSTGLHSPISSPPYPEILETARSLKNDEFSKPIQTPTGYSIVKRIGTRTPRNFQAMLPYLRRRRLIELHEQLLTRLREQGVKYIWSPADRDRKELTKRK